MNQPRLLAMQKGETLDGFLIVKSVQQRLSSNGSKYLDFSLADISGEINGKLWDGAVPAPNAPSVIRVKGVMTEFNGRLQFRVDKMRAVTEDDEVDMGLLVPSAPEPAGDMLDYVLNRVDAMRDQELKTLVLQRLEDVGDELLYYPAAQKLHHAERSGLLHHVSGMLRASVGILECYPSLDGDLLTAGIVLHDLCKIGEMRADATGMVSDYTRQGLLIGHLVQGVAELQRAARKTGLSQEKLDMLCHMLLSHHDLPEYGSPKPPMFPEAEVLHVLDILDARMFEMNEALKNARPGGFTERIWSLERRLYRREEPENE